eukprot:TRINITY_DN3888_c0_g1_i1.p3 TRINITY_DN3888_c0_g1~~TRINITY_DN3888_c0_g1_i1.p3  ORF type:complete len:66 (+),score=10.20 TRINITY_DN3888_c0_g1_i1:745-942(+)
MHQSYGGALKLYAAVYMGVFENHEEKRRCEYSCVLNVVCINLEFCFMLFSLDSVKYFGGVEKSFL